MRYRSIDVLRGLAATAVVLSHAKPEYSFGAIGVDIFFVVSGFVMAHVSRQRTPGQFLSDRAWRIFPVYWVLAVPWVLGGLAAGAVGPLAAMNSILLVPTWWLGIEYLFIGVAWTLAYELAFYGSVAAAMRLRRPTIPLLLFGFALLARPFTDNSLIAFAGHPIAVEFLFGIAIAMAPKNEGVGLGALGLGVAWLLMFPNDHLHNFLHNSEQSYALQRLALWGIPSALIVFGLICLEARLDRAWVKLPLLLGAASYSIYLVHCLVKALVDLPWQYEFVLAMAAGFMVWRLVEQPLLDYHHRMRRKARPDEGAPLPLQPETA